MKTLEEMKILIDEMRQTLSTAIEEKQDLLGVEVISIGQKLDDALNEYNNLLVKKSVKIRGV